MRLIRTAFIIQVFCAAVVSSQELPDSLEVTSIKESATQDEGGGRLEEINARIEAESLELEETRNKLKLLEIEQKELAAQVKKLQSQEATLKKELEKRQELVADVQTELFITDDSIAKIQNQARSRIRVLYMQKDSNFLTRIMLVSDQITVQRNAYFLNKVRDVDAKLIASFVELKKEKQEKLLLLKKAVEEQSKAQEKVQAQRDSLKEKLGLQERVVEVIRKQKAKLEKGVSSLKAQALRLETVLRSMTGSPLSEKKDVASKNSAREVKTVAAFSGDGLEKLKGKLSKPVQGVEKKSGAANGSIKSMMRLKGVDFETSSGAEIKAVAAGRVIYVGKMPELGNIVIIDHGSRSYSLYGRVETVGVALGDDLEGGEILGNASTAEDKSAVYFEIRKSGLSLDPRPYFKN